MVIIHIAHIDSSVIGGVQVAVPQILRAQSQYASVGMINTIGESIEGIQMLSIEGKFDKSKFPVPFNKPDIVVFHEVYRFEYISLYKELQNNRIPYIIIPHGCLSKQAQKRKYLKKIIANVVFFNAFLRSSISIQYLSENEMKMSAFSKYHAFIGGNGISLPQKRKTRFFEKGIRIVYIGRLEIQTKGLDLLLLAIKECGSLLRRVEGTVRIYGPDYNGEHTILCRMIDKLGIADIVSLDSEKMDKEKERILLDADCFVQTSRTEGLPMGLLEALGYGLPCIVTDGTGMGELIEKFEAGYRSGISAKGIAGAIRKFIEDREKVEALSLGAIRLVEKNFDINLIAQNTVNTYSKLVH